jgi:hypothetical protein
VPYTVGDMKNLAFGFIAAVLLLAACDGGSALSADGEAWCIDNPEIVDDAAGDLGRLGFVDVYYVVNGDGLESDGEPKLTDANISLSENMRARNSADPDALFDDLIETFLTHPDGQEACAAAYAEEF